MYLACPELVDKPCDASPPQLAVQLLNRSGSVPAGRGGKAASAKGLLKLRLFDLVPQFSYRLRYMPIDTDALYDILKLATHPLVVGCQQD